MSADRSLSICASNAQPRRLSPDGCTLYFGAGIYLATRAE